MKGNTRLSKRGIIMKNIIVQSILLILVFCTILWAKEITVTTFEELKQATDNASPHDTILLADGTYNITGTWAITIKVDNVTIRSKSKNREMVIINGRGMKADQHHGFWISGNGVTIQDISIQNVRNHCIQTDIDTDNLHVKNCILQNAGEQILKIPKGDATSPSENGIVEQCLFTYTAGIGPQFYIGGVDCHFGKNWIIRDNVFSNIRSPEDKIAEHAVHFWSNSEGTIVERNKIIDCDRGIGFGLGSSQHHGGIIRNNMIYHRKFDGHDKGDVGIALESSPNTKVYNNTIYFEHAYPNAIEYRFDVTKNVHIANNLLNKIIKKRNNASGNIENNITNSDNKWFKDVAKGDLHLASEDILSVIDKGFSLKEIRDDFDKAKRKDKIDIGADEFGVVNTKFHIVQSSYNIRLYRKDLYRYEIVTPIKGHKTIKLYTVNGKLIQQYTHTSNVLSFSIRDFSQSFFIVEIITSHNRYKSVFVLQ